jgi:hypothetical protein
MPGRTPAGGARAGRPSGGGDGAKDKVEDLVQLVVAYAKQETLDPVVKQLKALAKGIAGASLMALGTVLVAIGFLRALQSEFGGSSETYPPGFQAAPLSKGAHLVPNPYPYGVGAHLSGDWSWVPYMGGALFAVAVAAICVFRLVKGGPAR